MEKLNESFEVFFQAEVTFVCFPFPRRINAEFGSANYQPIVLIERPVPLYERIAFYSISQVCVVTAVRDGMNLVPYEYTVCREGTESQSRRRGNIGILGGQTREAGSREVGEREGGLLPPVPLPQGISVRPKRSMLVISEFIGCSPSLSGAFRVNPWNTEMVADALYSAISMSDEEQALRHEKHYRYISTHDVAFWAQSFLSDFQRICRY